MKQNIIKTTATATLLTVTMHGVPVFAQICIFYYQTKLVTFKNV